MPAPSTTDDPSRQAHCQFLAALAEGDYHALMGLGLRRALRGAAADPSLDPEIGALRLALTRLLNEEADPSRLAAGVARLAAVALQAARWRAPADDSHDEFRQTLLRDLAQYERELAARG